MPRRYFTFVLVLLLFTAGLVVLFTPKQTGFAIQNAVVSPAASRPATGAFKHGIVLEQSTQNVPSSWMHGNKNGGYGTYYVPPTWKHVEMHATNTVTTTGSEGVPVTVSATSYYPSAYVPPSYVHLGAAFGLDTTYVDPNSTYHVKIGPDATKEVGADSTHIEEGSNATKYVDDGQKHYTSPPEIATTIAGDGTKHADEDGPSKTKLVPDTYTHVDGSDCGGACTTYIPPEWHHVSTGQDLTQSIPDSWLHLTIGPKSTTHTSPSNHVDEGPQTTGYAKVHITMGETESTYVYDGFHVASGADATSYKQGSLPPAPTPTPPIEN